ncbi:MAG TPA: hypothetical protein VFV33_15805, partial [Gemmatimonadaceae bacterium]|nr:hypothetical protein [Gemmatimonadaceae bacterium]
MIEGIAVRASSRRPDWTRLTARVRYEGGEVAPEDVWFEVPDAHAESLLARGDPFVAALAPLAALRHERLCVEG